MHRIAPLGRHDFELPGEIADVEGASEIGNALLQDGARQHRRIEMPDPAPRGVGGELRRHPSGKGILVRMRADVGERNRPPSLRQSAGAEPCRFADADRHREIADDFHRPTRIEGKTRPRDQPLQDMGAQKAVYRSQITVFPNGSASSFAGASALDCDAMRTA